MKGFLNSSSHTKRRLQTSVFTPRNRNSKSVNIDDVESLSCLAFRLTRRLRLLSGGRYWFETLCDMSTEVAPFPPEFVEGGPDGEYPIDGEGYDGEGYDDGGPAGDKYPGVFE